MRIYFLALCMAPLVLFFGCKQKSSESVVSADASSITTASHSDSAGYKQITQAEADLMVKHFRNLSVRMNKPGDDKDNDSVTTQNMDLKVRRVLRAKFNQAFISLLDANVVGLSLVTGAYVDGAKKNKPTILIRLMKNDPSKSTVETFFYLPEEEDLCPEPPDCTGEIN